MVAILEIYHLWRARHEIFLKKYLFALNEAHKVYIKKMNLFNFFLKGALILPAL